MEHKTQKSERMYANKAIFDRKILTFKEMQDLHRRILEKMREMV